MDADPDKVVSISDDSENENSSPPTSAQNNKFSNDLLIEAVKYRLPIWDPEDHSFTNREIRSKLWGVILDEIRESSGDSTLTLSFIRKRWAQLRSSYLRSLKLPRTDSESESNRSKYDDQLSFLDGTDVFSQSFNCEDTPSEKTVASSTTTTTTTSTTTKRKFIEIEKGESSGNKRRLEESNGDQKSTEDGKVVTLSASAKSFAEKIAKDLEVFPAEVQRKLRLKIMDIVQKAVQDHNTKQDQTKKTQE